MISGYLTSVEASEILGIKRATLYSYASRGLIRIAPAHDGRKRMYLAADVDALRLRSAAARGHAAAAASALDWGQPVLESSITSIDVDGPNYRGVPATSLAERGVPFEAVAEHLWNVPECDRPARFEADGLGVDPGAIEALIPPGTDVHTLLGLVIASLGARDPLRFSHAEAAEWARARQLLRRLSAALALHADRSHWEVRADHALRTETVAAGLLQALGVGLSDTAVADVNLALVLCADHELNASGFAARVAASTGADLYGCVSAAMAVLGGPRHGGAADRVEALLVNHAPGTVRAMVGERFRLDLGVPGFGHRLYPDGDPRAVALFDRVKDRTTPQLDAVRELVAAMEEAGQPAPNLDVGLVAIARAVGLPPGGAAALFAMGRVAGWVAHTLEQRGSDRLLRPRARYVGP